MKNKALDEVLYAGGDLVRSIEIAVRYCNGAEISAPWIDDMKKASLSWKEAVENYIKEQK